VRAIAAGALALRSSAGIKVRQPLAKLILKDRSLEGKEDLLKIILDEVNVKEVVFDAKMAAEAGMQLDTVITPQLREEGLVRELTRAIQGLRASANYNMSDEIILMLVGDEKFTALVQRYSGQLKKAVNAKTLELKKGEKVDVSAETKLEDWAIWIGVRRP
jgi:isoleucyl-tRNA synthetase